MLHVECDSCRGIKHIPVRIFENIFTTVLCPKCHGFGFLLLNTTPFGS